MGFLSTVTDDLPEEETFTILARDIYFLCLVREWMKQTLVIWLKVAIKNSYQLKFVESSVLPDFLKGR
jgi:hypothetical protein